MKSDDITLQDIFLARSRIGSIAQHTPLIPSQKLASLTGTSVYLKLELLQPTGSFKLRGAANKIFSLAPEEKARGVVTVSTGNHGRAVAHVATHAEVTAMVCISERVPANKVAALQQTGAEVIISGKSQDEAEQQAYRLIVERGLTMIHPFDDPHIIAGQGTIGLELLLDLPQIDTALVPLSGGGLISGIALALKTANPAIQVIGVSMEQGCVMYHSLQAGKPVQLPEADTLADSLNGGIGLDNHYTYRMVNELVDDVVLVSEEHIAAAMALIANDHYMIVEGAGAVPVAALLSGQIVSPGKHIAIILSGGNVDTRTALRIFEEHGG